MHAVERDILESELPEKIESALGDEQLAHREEDAARGSYELVCEEPVTLGFRVLLKGQLRHETWSVDFLAAALHLRWVVHIGRVPSIGRRHN